MLLLYNDGVVAPRSANSAVKRLGGDEPLDLDSGSGPPATPRSARWRTRPAWSSSARRRSSSTAPTISPDAGIWPLAVPRFVDPLEERGGGSSALIDALRECDGLSTLSKHAPDTYDKAMTSLIERIEAMLRAIDDPCYRVHWHALAPAFNPATAIELRARIVAIAQRSSWVPHGRSPQCGRVRGRGARQW